MDRIRLLIADDHRFYREGVRTMLGAMPEVEFIGEAGTGEEAIALAADLLPDVILMDIKMPGIDGIEATRRIVRTSPHVGMLMVTMYDDDDSVFAALRAGARGYLLKDASLEDVLRAITAVSRGEAIFSPVIAQRMMQYFGQARSKPVSDAFPELTDREYEILTLIAQRCSNAEITARLVLSPKTVRNHVSNVLSKLQVADRAQAIVRAREAGLGS